MTSERLFNALADLLATDTTAAGGVFSRSETVAQTLSLLSGSAGRFRVILQWQREAPTGNRNEREMTVLVIVQQGGPNLGVNPGDAVSVQRPAAMLDTTHADSTTSSLNNAPLMQRCTEVNGWLRGVTFPAHRDVNQTWPVLEQGPAYWLNDPTLPTRQIAHEWKVRFVQDAVTQRVVAIGS